MHNSFLPGTGASRCNQPCFNRDPSLDLGLRVPIVTSRATSGAPRPTVSPFHALIYWRKPSPFFTPLRLCVLCNSYYNEQLTESLEAPSDHQTIRCVQQELTHSHQLNPLSTYMRPRRAFLTISVLLVCRSVRLTNLCNQTSGCDEVKSECTIQCG